MLTILLDHKHLIVRAEVEFPPNSCDSLYTWIIDLISKIQMKLAPINNNPIVWKCEDIGNEGFTAVAVITTSHISVHTWENPNVIQLDVYSCKEFDIKIILDHLSCYNIKEISFKFIDRNLNLKTIDQLD